jgi:DNA end-binding protein Ku
MPHSLWNGAISFGLVHIPVVLYSAENRNTFDLTMLDRRNMKPVGVKRCNKETEKEVGWDDIVKGYEYEKERYVVLTDEDFKRANIEATQTVDIVAFVDAEEVAPTYFETPYYLAPDKRGEKGYALLRETLRATKKIGIGTVVIRTRQYLAALIPSGDVIVLNTLRYENELKSAKDLEVPSGNLKASGVSPREIEMAKKLVEEMTDQWKPERYRDTYHDDLMKLIDKRIKAGKTEVIIEAEADEVEKKPARGEVIDLMALLKRSVQAKGRSSTRSKRSSMQQERHPRQKSA